VTSALTLHADVVVVGGGLSALWLAHRLADHASVLLVDSKEQTKSPSRSSLGIVAAGQCESPARLETALGHEQARRLWEWSQHACLSLRELANELHVSCSDVPVVRLSLDPREEAELQRSVELITSWEGSQGLQTLQAQELASLGLGVDFSFGMQVRSDFVLDPASLLSALEHALKDRVRRTRGNYMVTGVHGGYLQLQEEDHAIRTELAVVAGGAGSAAVHPWLKDAVIPVRIHRSSLHSGESPEETSRASLAGVCRDRFESWVQSPNTLQFAGCRWAEGPDLGATRAPSIEVVDAVIKAQVSFIERHLQGDTRWSLESRHSTITDFSCDGLPLIGALPGSPRVLAMCGWNGWGFSAIGAAVNELSAAILGREAEVDSPHELLNPRRLL
jgi:glycine/D-amino acid oxidase-like deaminating enzyme